MKHLSSALTAIRRSPYQTFAAILILSITFFIGYTFSLTAFGTEQILRYFETRPQITGFFKVDAPQTTIDALQKSMQAKPYVNQVTIISKEKALELYRQDNQKDPMMLELVTEDILPASIEVSGKNASDLNQIQQDLQGSDGVDEVVYAKDVVTSLTKWTSSMRYIGIASVAILAFTSFLIVFIITGMKVATQKKSIQIVRLLGASKWYVNAPFVYEGMIYGLVGSIIGWSAMYVGLLYSTPWLTDFLGSVSLAPASLESLLLVLAAGSVLGLLLGAIASTVAVQRMMRKA